MELYYATRQKRSLLEELLDQIRKTTRKIQNDIFQNRLEEIGEFLRLGNDAINRDYCNEDCFDLRELQTACCHLEKGIVAAKKLRQDAKEVLKEEQKTYKGQLYYIRVSDGQKQSMLAGPYSSHEAANLALGAVRKKAEEIDDRAIWMTFSLGRSKEKFKTKFDAISYFERRGEYGRKSEFGA